jgi:hypothetical protein
MTIQASRVEPDRQSLLRIIYAAIDEINRQMPDDAKVMKDPSAKLLGEGSVLDSLGVITFLVSVEKELQSGLGLELVLLDEEALANPTGPYRSIDSLVNWILAKIR